VNLEKHSAWVTGKGRKDRPVFFGAAGAAALRAYQETVKHQADDAVWWTLDGATPLTYWGMYQAIKRIGNKAGVGHCNPHRFRHGFGRRLSKNGCPTLVLQNLMGHASSETTRIYTFLDEEDLSKLHERYA
jgi:site-specific recombinase XerD